ncbi:thiopeptide-type bacteriocin biosynthesis protein [Saccharopolyspora phatthalungensis]|uniref:Thiopeptide-type bacteriocin biosynthesis protein n=1 Tax=Saccharopolyspora phatthalungensis TaxID=664693 RepID=A0A840QBR4_9PSEU|nr:thiopeptide-type bacteriocin biosynthesis protein [Saccharopolyspora phatthalungensis]MBB5156088.1 thiopeptide-type bacteriocin biosynthesis protein [Saccharopolyspora phatthalungensis]
MERAVLATLTGTPAAEAARVERVEPTDLAEAVEIYRRAGRYALQQQTASDWWQLYIQFTDWKSAEQTFTNHIVPVLHQAENDALVTAWWFMRKHPCWRLRLHPGPDGQQMKPRLGTTLDELAANSRIAAWWPGIYEAETAAFGGDMGMSLAHGLFSADSRAIVHVLRDGDIALGRRELSLLLCSILMRAPGLEWYEQGDVWDRVSQERHFPENVPTAKLTAMTNDLKQLMLADTSPDGPLLGKNSPLNATSEWADAFRRTGQSLGAAARAGTLQRGLREVLAYLVIFHWNRIGLPARTQSILACAARTAILGQPAASASRPAANRHIAAPLVRPDGPAGESAK